MNAHLTALLTRFRPVAKEYQKNTLAVSHDMVNKLADNRKQVEAGTLTRGMAINNLRVVAGLALQRVNIQSSDFNALAVGLQNAMNNHHTYNATELVGVTREMLDIAQEVSLEMTTTLRSIRANWEDYEAQLETWVKDIHKGLK